jgi:hypothetical protein
MLIRALYQAASVPASVESFQETICYCPYKYHENQVMTSEYSAGCIVVLVAIYGFLARNKKQ